VITAENITDEQIRELLCEPANTQLASEALGTAFAVHALRSGTYRKARRMWARAHCAEILEARRKESP